MAPAPGARYSRVGPFAIGMQKNLRDTSYVIGHLYSKSDAALAPQWFRPPLYADRQPR